MDSLSVFKDTLIETQLNTKDYLELIIQGLTAVGTILLALIAVYGERVKRWLFKPKLKIIVSGDKPYISTIKDSSATSVAASVTRIRIKALNEGTSAARSFTGLVESVFCKRPQSETFYKSKSLPPTPLPWNDEEKDFSLTPRIPFYLEIARIEKNLPSSIDGSSNTLTSSEYSLYLSVEEEEQKGAYIHLGKGTFIVPITFYSDNIKIPIKMYFEIFWDGIDPSCTEISNFYIKEISTYDVKRKVGSIP